MNSQSDGDEIQKTERSTVQVMSGERCASPGEEFLLDYVPYLHDTTVSLIMSVVRSHHVTPCHQHHIIPQRAAVTGISPASLTGRRRL